MHVCLDVSANPIAGRPRPDTNQIVGARVHVIGPGCFSACNLGYSGPSVAAEEAALAT